jgi:hypothetical protein
MAEHKEHLAQGWASLVPEFFFDIIARVLPGAYLVLGAGKNVSDPRSSALIHGRSSLGLRLRRFRRFRRSLLALAVTSVT